MGSDLPGWKDGKPPPARTAWQKEIGGGCKRCKRGFMAFVWEGEPLPEFCLECERLNYEDRIARLEAVVEAARKLKPYWVEITRGLCLLLAEDQTVPVVGIQKCIGVWVEAIEALEESDGE